jgi:hypothetical protein
LIEFAFVALNDELLVFSLINLCVFIPLLPDPGHSQVIISQLKPVLNGDIFVDLLLLALFVLKVLELLPHDETLRTTNLLCVLQLEIRLLAVLLLGGVQHNDPVLAVLNKEFRVLSIETLVEIVQECHQNEQRDDRYERD